MKIAIIGANGQLGTDLQEVLSTEHNIVGLDHSDIEITDIDNVKNVLSSIKPQLVLNTAAYNLVPKAEQYPELAFQINAIGPLNLAKICSDLRVRLAHFSTDYVFDGKKQKPYTEDDPPNPLNAYANTKLSGEYFTLNYCQESFVIRASIKLAKEKPEVKVVDDEILTPTPTYYIAKNTAELIKTNSFGLFHMSCEGEVSWYEFAKVIWETLKLPTPLYSAHVKDFPQEVRRPFYSVLENRNLNKLGINNMPHWKEGLVNFLTGEM